MRNLGFHARVASFPPRVAAWSAIQGDFADATRIVYLAMAGILAASFLIAVRRMERGIPGSLSMYGVGGEATCAPTTLMTDGPTEPSLAEDVDRSCGDEENCERGDRRLAQHQ
jgi:hypothetical protein